MYCMKCSLPKDISQSLRVVVCEDEKNDALERCDKRGFFKIKPPKACKMFEKPIVCTYLALQEAVLSDKSGVFEETFVKHTSAFRDTALKLRETLYDWLWHIWIKQSTTH